MKFKDFLPFILVSLLALLGCEKTQTACTSGSTDPACATGGDVTEDNSLLAIEFKDTYHFDSGHTGWVNLTTNLFNQGLITAPIYVYSSYVNMGLSEALRSVVLAKEQIGETAGSLNEIPYIEFTAKEGVTYLYQYQKYDESSGTLISDFQGTVPVQGTRALLPIINASFNRQYYSIDDTLGKRYKNVISLTAQTAKNTGAIYQIQFISVYSSQKINYDLVFSDEMNSFSLDSRWDYYKNASKTGPNSNLNFFTFKDKQGASTISLTDVQVVFKSEPKLQIKQEIFFELPFQGDLFKLSGTVVPDRGSKFYVAPLTLDSSRDFKMKVYLGGELLTRNSLTFQKFSFPSGKALDIGFAFDLNKNDSYGANSGDPNNKGLQYPLKPVCWELKNNTYEPWIIEPLKNDAVTKGQYYAVCDLDETKSVGPITFDQTKLDTWYNYFSYAPQRLDKNELGHLFGIRSITFKIEACIKLQVRAPGTDSWETTSKGEVNCGGIDSDLWTPVIVEKTFTIYDDISKYKNIQGLSSLIERFKSSAVETYTKMKFNNEILDGDKIRHLY